MPELYNLTTLPNFLGLTNYYQVFIPNIHTLRTPLNELLRKNKVWNWTTECKMTFEKLKEVLTSELFLINYNPDLDIIVTSDVSAYSIGMCIFCIKWPMVLRNQ